MYHACREDLYNAEAWQLLFAEGLVSRWYLCGCVMRAEKIVERDLFNAEAWQLLFAEVSR